MSFAGGSVPITEHSLPATILVPLQSDECRAELLVRLGVDLPSAPKVVQNVVEKTGVDLQKKTTKPHFAFLN